MNTTGWLKGLRVTADGAGIVSHAGVTLVRALSDTIGLTAGLSKALASDRLLVRVIVDQDELFGLVASVPTAWRTLAEIARGGERCLSRITAAVNAARRRAWAAAVARHGAIPGIRVADKVLAGVTCIRLDATVIAAHSDKEGAEPNFKGFGLLTELRAESSQFSGRSRSALAAASPPRQKITPRTPGHASRITFDGHRPGAETTIKIEPNLKFTAPHPERGDLRAGTCPRRRQLSRKYSAIGRHAGLNTRSRSVTDPGLG